MLLTDEKVNIFNTLVYWDLWLTVQEMAEVVEMSNFSYFTVSTENICNVLVYFTTSDSWTKKMTFAQTFFNNLKQTRISWNNYWWAVWHRLIGVVMKWSSSLYSGIEVEMKLPTYFHLPLRRGMSGVVSVLPQYAFMACMGTTLPRAVHYWKNINMDTT